MAVVYGDMKYIIVQMCFVSIAPAEVILSKIVEKKDMLLRLNTGSLMTVIIEVVHVECNVQEYG